MRLNIASKSGKRIAQLSAERLVNMYAEPAGDSFVVFGSEGLSVFSSVGTGPIKGQAQIDGALCVVSGDDLYTVDSVGNSTNRGSVVGFKDMASNGTYICLVTGKGGTGYLFDGTTLSAITDTDFSGADTVDVLDGYFIFTDGTGSFFINETPFNGANYDALDFASAESNPDNILKVVVDHREVLLFGQETIESWYNSGDADFPFERTPGAIIEKGLSGIAATKIDNTVMWADNNGVVRRMADGYGSVRISTHEIEAQLGNFAGAKAFSYTHKGHEWLVLTTGGGTFVYDAATNLWHERDSWQKSRWRADNHIRIYGKNLVGSFDSGDVYALDDSVYTDGGEILVSEMVFPPIRMDGDKFKLSSLQLDMEQGSAGDVTLWLSDDGEVWRNAGIRSMGAIGDRGARTIWRSLGQHRDLHLKFTFSDAVQRAVFAAYAEIT